VQERGHAWSISILRAGGNLEILHFTLETLHRAPARRGECHLCPWEYGGMPGRHPVFAPERCPPTGGATKDAQHNPVCIFG